MAEVHGVGFLHTRETGHPDKIGCIVCLQEEDPYVNIWQDWTALEVEVREGYHHEEVIYNESYELVNVDIEGGLIEGYGSPFGKTYKD